MRKIRKCLDELVIYCMRISLIDRICGYLSYQRRRKTRRVIEASLITQGVYPDVIQFGPFSGLKLPCKSFHYDARFEKVFGYYENELFDTIESIIAERPTYDRVIISGAADGFYAVGLALRMPESKITAFEIDPYRLCVLEKTSELNQTTTRVEIAGRCEPESLESCLHNSLKPLLICDVDGYEDILLNLDRLPSLKKASILVETHDCFVKGVSSRLKTRFSDTHCIEEIPMHGPDYGRLSFLTELTMHEVDSLLHSDRPMLQTWLWMHPTTCVNP